MQQPIEYYVKLVKQMFLDENIQKKIRTYSKIDDMMNCYYKNPDELAGLGWIKDRKLVSTAPADAVNAATRAFAARKPNVSVLPLNSSPKEYARVERIEKALDWALHDLNRKGKQPMSWQIVDSAMRYCKVALQVEYLPWQLKDYPEGTYKKAIIRSGAFNWRIHHPSTVFAYEGAYGLPEFVVKKAEYTASYLASRFGRDNSGVQAMMKAIDDGADAMKKKMWFFDVTTWDERIQWASQSENGDDDEGGAYLFMKETHDLPFMPWVVVDNEDMILKSVVDAGLWENANAIRTIVFSKAIDMAARSALWIKTLSGNLDNVHIDNTNPSQPIVSDLQTDIQPLPPPQIDQQIATVKEMADSEIFRSSVAQILVSIEEIGQTSTFSTVNAMLQAALTQLVLSQNTAERAMEQAFHQSLELVGHSKIDWILQRKTRSKIGNYENRIGDQIIITGNKKQSEIPEDEQVVITPINPDYLYIDVELQSVNIVDKQAEQNIAINEHERLGASLSLIYDKYGMGDYDQHEVLRGEEDLTQAEIQADVKRTMLAPDVEVQQAQMAMQAQMASAQPQGNPEQPSAEQQAADQAAAQDRIDSARANRSSAMFSGQQGVDSRTGGNPPTAGAPGVGREQITGKTVAQQ